MSNFFPNQHPKNWWADESIGIIGPGFVSGVGSFHRAVATEAYLIAELYNAPEKPFEAPVPAYINFTPPPLTTIPFNLRPYYKEADLIQAWNTETGQRKHRKPTPTNRLPGKPKRRKPGKKTHRKKR